ncbi:DUF7219 family protein [Fischerella sp. PCC 9605]|uniref:DUF7219 family protein n=1 Tax=Fischerella sp. PCC 9605 TaxID=1173024 RepID=UPI0004BB616C|nr:hypothetical protein [Fischerella sp. PCC 9605]
MKANWYGQSQAKYLALNVNLREFYQRVNYICYLQTHGKLSPQDAYTQLEVIWKQLKLAKKEFDIS